MRFFAVFGFPINHSISPLLHNKAILDLKLDAIYSRYELENSNFLISKFKELGLDGANVTIPHKVFALEQADLASNDAINIGSANTLVKQNNGQIMAHNTDVLGFIKAMEQFGNKFKSVKNALILGAGGTSMALAYGLKKIGISVEILNRSEKRLINFQNNYYCSTWNNFKIKKFDLIVNTTSAGLNDENLPLPYEILIHILEYRPLVFDVIYGKLSPLMKIAKKNNLICQDGKLMLIFQAVYAFNLFYNDKLDITKIFDSMIDI